MGVSKTKLLPIEEYYNRMVEVKLASLSSRDDLGPKTAKFLASSLDDIVYNIDTVEKAIESNDAKTIRWICERGSTEFVDLVREKVKIKVANPDVWTTGDSFNKPYNPFFDRIDNKISECRLKNVVATFGKAMSIAKEANEPESFVSVLLNHHSRLLRK